MNSKAHPAYLAIVLAALAGSGCTGPTVVRDAPGTPVPEPPALSASTPDTAIAAPVVVPYPVPAPGVAIAIGTNDVNSVRPPEIPAFQWAYALFQAYGTGTFVPDYSPAGAFVIAATGGHGVAPIVDAVLFDFSDATWKRIPNANGIAPRDHDYDTAETTQAPYYEILAATAGQIPAPSHLYGLAAFIPTARGGGPHGSYLKMGSPAVTAESWQGSGIHRMDLATGLWTRATPDTLHFSYNYEATAVFDPAAGRCYFMPDGMHAFEALQYLDLADWRVKSTPAYPMPAQMDATYQTTFLDPGRRLIVAQRPGYPLRALNLNRISSGWQVLASAGVQPSEANRWAYYPPDGRFYTRTNNSGETLHRLTPPDDWQRGTWTFDTVTVSGAPLPPYTTTGGMVRHYGTFFYVPAIRSLAWISGESTPVVILKPPSGDGL